MIRPEPESDLSLNELVVSADILKILKKETEPYLIDKLASKFIEADSRRTKELFFNCLTLLFALGAITEKNYKVKLKYDYTQKTLF